MIYLIATSNVHVIMAESIPYALSSLAEATVCFFLGFGARVLSRGSPNDEE